MLPNPAPPLPSCDRATSSARRSTAAARLRRPADDREGSRHRARSGGARRRSVAASSSATARTAPRLEQLRDELELGERVRFLGSASRDGVLGCSCAARTRRCSPRPGRTSRTRVVESLARRDAGDRDASRRRAGGRDATARTACSSAAATSPRSPPRSRATSAIRSCGHGCAPRPRPPSRSTGRTRSTVGSSRSSRLRRHEAPRPLRRADPLPAAALRDAAPQVGCACGRARRARRRVVLRRVGRRRHVPPAAADAARRPAASG